MKHYLKIALITSAVMLVVIGGLAGLAGKGYFSIQDKEKETSKEELDINLYDKPKRELGNTPVTTLSTKGEDKVLTFSHKNAKDIYNVKTSKRVKQMLDEEKKADRYNFDSPLWAYNPFGTNELSLYLYFNTPNAAKLKYTIQVKNDDIPDFTRTCYNKNGMQVSEEHEYQIIGLVPGMENYIYLDLYDSKGEVTKSAVYRFKPDKLAGNIVTQLMTVDGKSTEQVSNGLYFFLGHDTDNKKAPKKIYLYDNSGVIRGSIPLVNYRTDRFLMKDGQMLYNYSNKGFAAVNSIGQVMKTYDLGRYTQHHDFIYDGYGHLLVLASKNGEKSIRDRIVSLDLKNGKVKELVDLGKIIPKMKKKASKGSGTKKLNWINLNSIAMVGSNSVAVSSKELSSILKIDGITSILPSLDYIIGANSIWEKTKYKDKVYQKAAKESEENEGDTNQTEASGTNASSSTKNLFMSQFGQSDISVINENGLDSEQYYIMMYNNNYGNSDTRKDIKWSSIRNVGTKKKEASTSKYYKYYVDEAAGTYQLAETFRVPYSNYDSSIQDYNGHFIVNSGLECSVGEYDREGVLIHGLNYNVSTYTYRVRKESMKNFWFQ